MIAAGAWGLVGASSLVLGALIAFSTDLSPRVRGLILAFGAGTLLGAVAYELIEEAVKVSATGIEVALGFAAGAIVFWVGSIALDGMDARSGAGADPDEDRAVTARRRSRSLGLAVVLGAVLDGIPESIVLGISLIGTGTVGIPILVAIFVSNIPESLSASEDLAQSGMSRGRILTVWILVALASGLAAALGFGLLDTAAPGLVALIQAFAGGAILAMLAETMIPEASEIGGRAVGLATCFGFAVAAALSFSG